MYKNKKFIKSKNWHITKGVNKWFWSENGNFFHLFFLRQYRPGKCVSRYSKTKKPLFGAIKTRSSIVQKLTFFQRGYPMVLVQKWPFWQLLFFSNIGQKNVFYDILERKNAFRGYKNKKLKMSKNWHFSMEVVKLDWSKKGHYSNFFFLGNIDQ